jgi:hypothetical protein
MKKYTGKSEIEAGAGGSRTGGAGNVSSGRMGNAGIRAKVDAKDAAAEARRQSRLEKLTEKRHAKNNELEKANTPEGIAYRKQLYDMGITTSDFDFKKGGKVKGYADGGSTKMVKKPAPKPMTDTDTPPMTSGMREALKDQKEQKMRKQMGEAYDKANVNKGYKQGGKVKCMSKGGGCEVRGKTKGRMI